MKLIKTIGLVIRENEFSESDKIITLLTPEYGKISVMAKGIKKKKRYLSSTEIYSLSNYILFKGTKMYHLNEAELIENFYDIRFSYDKMILASNIFKKAAYFADTIFTRQERYELFKTTVASLYSIVAADDEKLNIIFSIYILRVMKIIGLSLNYEKIEKENDISVGNNIGKSSSNNNYNYNENNDNSDEEKVGDSEREVYIADENFKVPLSIYEMIRYIQNEDISKIFWVNTNADKAKILNDFTNVYYNNHLK